ncbi:MAG: heme biosynthesis operon protein HemX, partial [Gammaproteobacteria bacterium HGW-Gammaproteobacteria-12]
MSEASTPNTPEEKPASEAVKPTPAPPPAKAPRSGGGSGLAALALLIGLAGAGAGGWSLWQLHQMQGRDQQQAEDLQRTRDDSATQVADLSRQLDKRLSELPSASELDERR